MQQRLLPQSVPLANTKGRVTFQLERRSGYIRTHGEFVRGALDAKISTYELQRQ